METSEIRYRVADFLKQHPPFTAVDDQDLVALAGHGRVRFFPENEFLAWQGEPHKTHVLVIQQGTVSLWDEQNGQAELRDVRGPGDWIGAEQLYGADACLHTARANTDVVTYGFPAPDIAALLDKYPYAAAFVAAMGSVTSTLSPAADAAADPLTTYLRQFAGPLHSCSGNTTIAEAARLLLDTGAGALAVTDPDAGFLGLLTPAVVLSWVARGAGDAARPVAEAGVLAPGFVGPGTSVADGALAMLRTGGVAMTDDGTARGRLVTIVTPRDLLPAFGDQPAAILEDVVRAADVPALRAANQRARAFVLAHLAGAPSAEWMACFTTRVDDAILARVFELTGQDPELATWFVYGTSGRTESLPARMPELALIHPAGATADVSAAFVRVAEALAECGYIQPSETGREPSFYVATADHWVQRFVGWIRNPVIEGLQRNRALFDLRGLWGAHEDRVITKAVHGAIDRDILRVLAHDCLADLPPLSFFEDEVVEHDGEVSRVFRLQRNVLQPLVDLGRVFGMAARDLMGTSTLQRFAAARRILPAHERIFRDAAEAVRIVLWQQGRVGIRQGTTGAELPPSALTRHDRHLLKSTFPVIQRLIEFTAAPGWLDAIDDRRD